MGWAQKVSQMVLAKATLPRLLLQPPARQRLRVRLRLRRAGKALPVPLRLEVFRPHWSSMRLKKS
eukprot:6380452-Pyramimonas_sp.AAC.1